MAMRGSIPPVNGGQISQSWADASDCTYIFDSFPPLDITSYKDATLHSPLKISVGVRLTRRFLSDGDGAAGKGQFVIGSLGFQGEFRAEAAP